MISVVDYDAGNVQSVLKALHHLGAPAQLTADPALIRAADLVVFPGQGHFGQAMARLRGSGLDTVLRETIAADRPFLGVCLGLQLLFEASDEAPGVAGLGALPGRCERFGPEVKVPQIGWNQVDVARAGSPLDDGPDRTHFYFVHSFHACARRPEDVVGTALHGQRFTAAVGRGRLFAAQFHPEKSGAAGLGLLRACLRRAGIAGPDTTGGNQ